MFMKFILGTIVQLEEYEMLSEFDEKKCSYNYLSSSFPRRRKSDRGNELMEIANWNGNLKQN